VNSCEFAALRYVVALAEANSFTKAAEAVFVVQSALSQQVRRFETEIGLRLFERTTRSVSLTAAGEALMPLLRQVVAGIDQIALDAQALSGTVCGRLTVGMMEVPSESLDVATLMATFHSRYPDVSVTLRSGGSDVLIEAVRDRNPLRAQRPGGCIAARIRCAHPRRHRPDTGIAAGRRS